MKKLLREFKEFALRGDAMNLAVGVIIGAAFQGIVRSLTDDILSPIIGLFLKGNLDALVIHAFGAEIRCGAFITAIMHFIIMAVVVFLIVKAMNALMNFHSKDAQDAPATKECPYCKSSIPIAATRCPNCTSQLED
ncbi:MAG: large conductance mechanosensitive channel protein MscL [Oscillospiraceae bacterium]|jgi:large conductance mechanosensitive channel|nr:large conductance mechanosensitive channel protein MscL [Oscillospiraceae bacterium]